jgi:hypothetical protein
MLVVDTEDGSGTEGKRNVVVGNHYQKTGDDTAG